MKLMVLRLMYRLTSDRRWLLRYIDTLDEEIYNDIQRWRKENGQKIITAGRVSRF